MPISNPESLKLALCDALGISVVVNKRREIFLWNNVRIHLDEVKHLGTFIEFEAVLAPGVEDAVGYAQLAELRRHFDVRDNALLETSYSDLMLRASAAGENIISSPCAP